MVFYFLRFIKRYSFTTLGYFKKQLPMSKDLSKSIRVINTVKTKPPSFLDVYYQLFVGRKNKKPRLVPLIRVQLNLSHFIEKERKHLIVENLRRIIYEIRRV